MADLAAILGQAALDRFHATGSLSCGLPAAAYTSPDFLALEFQAVFAAQWVFVGFCHEMAAVGDVCPVQVGDRPVLLVRTKAGEIKAFHNVCRHRCATLVEEAGNVGRLIRCPYHAWVYGLEGDLRSAPHFGGPERHFPDGFDQKSHGLIPVRSATWGDWVFVNLDGAAPDFAIYAKPLMTQMEGLDFAACKPIASIDFGEIKTNWKFLMENFMEPYHVQFLHSSTTDQPLLDHYTIVDGPCLGSAVDVGDDPPDDGPGDKAGATLAVSSRYLTLFPTFVLGWYFPDQMGVYHNVPVAPGITRQRRMLYHTRPESLDDAAVEQIKALWTGVHHEDHWICERLQRGRNSPVAAAGGVLSPHWETPVRRFQELILARCSA